MKFLIILSILLGSMSGFAQGVEGDNIYLECTISDDGINPRIPRTFQVFINYEQRNWFLTYNIPGVSSEKTSLIANGDIYSQKQSQELGGASFQFEDGSYLDIDFTIGKLKSDNILFKSLEKATLKDCIIF